MEATQDARTTLGIAERLGMPNPKWEEVRDASGKLLFEIDAERELARIVKGGKRTVVDLKDYLKDREGEKPAG